MRDRCQGSDVGDWMSEDREQRQRSGDKGQMSEVRGQGAGAQKSGIRCQRFMNRRA